MSLTEIARSSTRVRKAITAVLLTLCLAGTLVPTANAAVTEPRLRLLAPNKEVTLYRYGPGESVYLDLGVLIGALDAPFELRATRPDYTQPAQLHQVLYGQGGQTQLRALDPSFLDGWLGLADFFNVTFHDDTGAAVSTTSMTFCPGSYDRQRLNDGGPDVPTYPSGCFSNPFTKGAIWGVDAGWAVSTTDYGSGQIDLPNGLYQVAIRIPDTYIQTFAIDPAYSSAQMTVRIKTYPDFSCPPRCARDAANQPGTMQASAVPVDGSPPPSALPDLVALPSWGIAVENRRDRSLLSFGATVWNSGAAPLVVEGFRREGQPVMDAYQYFYEGDQVVGKAPAGELVFDDRDGHDHWHFKQFAAYSLLDAELNDVRVSRKEAFCLAPTDAIDLTLPDADWNPGLIGLTSACGGPNSMWTRETLPLGWGDTYFQGLPGQSFWITKLPNGTYFIKVEANPGGQLQESTATNNVELREIIISGSPGHRRVEVPLWNGIDTEVNMRPGKGGIG
jgi:hypothetical protein